MGLFCHTGFWGERNSVFVQCFVSLTQKSRFLFEPCHRCVYECSNTTWCVYMILADGSLKTLHSMCRLKIYNNGLATFHEWERGVLPKKSSENVVRSTILIYNTGFDLIICIEKRSWEGKKRAIWWWWKPMTKGDPCNDMTKALIVQRYIIIPLSFFEYVCALWWAGPLRAYCATASCIVLTSSGIWTTLTLKHVW